MKKPATRAGISAGGDKGVAPASDTNRQRSPDRRRDQRSPGRRFDQRSPGRRFGQRSPDRWRDQLNDPIDPQQRLDITPLWTTHQAEREATCAGPAHEAVQQQQRSQEKTAVAVGVRADGAVVAARLS